MILLNLIVLAVCCLALESKKKTNKQTTREREREREREEGAEMHQISKQNNSQVSIITIVSRKYKDRQTDCQQKMRIACYFPICPHQSSSDKPR
jgi:Holliday junction resolvase RusA-like endonuclease